MQGKELCSLTPLGPEGLRPHLLSEGFQGRAFGEVCAAGTGKGSNCLSSANWKVCEESLAPSRRADVIPSPRPPRRVSATWWPAIPRPSPAPRRTPRRTAPGRGFRSRAVYRADHPGGLVIEDLFRRRIHDPVEQPALQNPDRAPHAQLRAVVTLQARGNRELVEDRRAPIRHEAGGKVHLTLLFSPSMTPRTSERLHDHHDDDDHHQQTWHLAGDAVEALRARVAVLDKPRRQRDSSP